MTTDLTMTDVLDTLEFLGACSEGTHSVRAYVDPEATLRGAAIERTLWLVGRLIKGEYGDKEPLLTLLFETTQRTVLLYSKHAKERSLLAYAAYVRDGATPEERHRAYIEAGEEWANATTGSAAEAFAYVIYTLTLSSLSVDSLGYYLFRSIRCQFELESILEGSGWADGESYEKGKNEFLAKMSEWIFAAMDAANKARLAAAVA